MPTITFSVDQTQHQTSTTLTSGSQIKNLAGLSPSQLLILNINNESDIIIGNSDYLILKGDEKFFSAENSGLSENPSLITPLKFKINGRDINNELCFNKAKITTEELLVLAAKNQQTHKVLLDLPNQPDIALPNNVYIVVGSNWNSMLVPLEGEPVDLECCDEAPEEPAASYRIKIDGKKYITDKPHLTGSELLTLAGKANVNQHSLHLILKGGGTELIKLCDKVDFTKPGIEKLFTIPLDMTEGFEPRKEFDVLPEDESFLNSLNLTWEAIFQGGIRRIIVHDYPIPNGYNLDKARLNIRIESGYPDNQIDMVYFYPALNRLDRKPIKAIATDQFDSVQWQRWSRHRTHQNKWRPGIDNIASHFAAINSWLLTELNK
jgi:hypothetical protein